MKTTTSRRLGVAALSALLTAAALTGAANASPDRAASAKEPTQVTGGTATESTPQVERERGLVLEGSAEVGALPVMLTVYENDRYGNSIQVVVGDPEDDRVGYLEQTTPFVVDGVLDVTVTVDGAPLELHGTVTESGRAERMTESLEDHETRIISRGTHQTLAVEATVTYAGVSATAVFETAFAYDLEVRKTPLHGNGTR